MNKGKISRGEGIGIGRLTGEKVVVREICPVDLPILWHYIYGEKDPEWKRWDAPYFPLTFETKEAYIERMTNWINNKEDVPSRMVIEAQERIIGTVSYYWEHKESLWLEVGIVIYDSSYWNGGYGTEALKLWIDYLFASMPLVRVGLATWSGNERMIRCAEKLGMKMEGRLRKCRWYNGQYYDSIRMGVLREEWNEKKQGLNVR
ncbi:GNAT family N-acetyltransferase [Anoxybacteroides tepidamans]|uniref:GNAT family N-acetyltransferase n=1 Tax=Anoxybacteroides tepidamans TaxID=265948 RepID=UPI000ABB8675|nr:GNAT family protein [Anoxybacillus tepidamans]